MSDSTSAQESTPESTRDLLFRAKQAGFSDLQIASIVNRVRAEGGDPLSEDRVRAWREGLGVAPVYKSVDTCAGEFEAMTPYYYSSYEQFTESAPSEKKKIVILGGGPNRIGQGIEFDYCCVQAVFALQDEGFETIMINSNPETVSTDYDTADKLYFEPLTIEDVLAICQLEKPDGVIVQFGGQTPLNLARGLEAAGVPIIGTSPDSIDLAEDREQFGTLLEKLDIPQPENGYGRSIDEIREVANRIGYPVLVRPSYVLGGRAMQIVWTEDELEQFVAEAHRVSEGRPVLVDRFLNDAVEVDVDALADGERVTIGAVMEHIEQAGIHSGDSACVIPTRTLSVDVLGQIKDYTEKLGLALQVKGLMNIQYAVKDEKVYVIEVNPRASRTVPFVSKSTGVPLAQYAAKIMVGKTLEDLEYTEPVTIDYYSVKEAVLPFDKFPGCKIELGPEMRSTGEVMGVDVDYEMAFAKSQVAAGMNLPESGTVFVSVNDRDKPKFEPVARGLHEMGFELLATTGTATFLSSHGVPAKTIYKINEGHPNVGDFIINGQVAMVMSTFSREESKFDEAPIRSLAVAHSVPLVTTAPAARAAVLAMKRLRERKFDVAALQDYHARLAAKR